MPVTECPVEGRLIVTSAKRQAFGQLGAVYRLLAPDAGAQFAELLTVLGLPDAVDAGGSRCGICNGDEWATLRPGQVGAGQVPAGVLAAQRVFYRCGRCQQIFWPGEKYESTMEGLRAEVVEPPRAGTAGRAWRPPVGAPPATAPPEHAPEAAPPTVPPTGEESIGRQVRAAGLLHSTARMKLEPPTAGTR